MQEKSGSKIDLLKDDLNLISNQSFLYNVPIWIADTSNSSTTFAEDQYRQKYTENLEEAMGIRKDERILSYSSRPLAVEGYHNRDKVFVIYFYKYLL